MRPWVPVGFCLQVNKERSLSWAVIHPSCTQFTGLKLIWGVFRLYLSMVCWGRVTPSPGRFLRAAVSLPLPPHPGLQCCGDRSLGTRRGALAGESRLWRWRLSPQPSSPSVLFLTYPAPPMSPSTAHPQTNDSQSFSQTILGASGWHSHLLPGQPPSHVPNTPELSMPPTGPALLHLQQPLQVKGPSFTPHPLLET